jgi:hypothetical protein
LVLLVEWQVGGVDAGVFLGAHRAFRHVCRCVGCERQKRVQFPGERACDFSSICRADVILRPVFVGSAVADEGDQDSCPSIT